MAEQNPRKMLEGMLGCLDMCLACRLIHSHLHQLDDLFYGQVKQQPVQLLCLMLQVLIYLCPTAHVSYSSRAFEHCMGATTGN
jgi:hypothetical protein